MQRSPSTELIWQVHIAQQSTVQICQVGLQDRIIMFSWHSIQGYIVSGSVQACMDPLHCVSQLFRLWELIALHQHRHLCAHPKLLIRDVDYYMATPLHPNLSLIITKKSSCSMIYLISIWLHSSCETLKIS